MSFAVPGLPVAQGSKRHVGRGIMVESGGAKLYDWRQDIRNGAIEQLAPLLREAVRVELDFYFPRPKGHFGKRGLRPSAPLVPTVRPDLDKLARACLDALTGICFVDDSQVAMLVCRKHYAQDGSPPGVVVEIAPM